MKNRGTYIEWSCYEMRGRVTKFFNEKGYGFITDENGESRFFHISNVIVNAGEISTGSIVNFQPHSNEKGLTCLKIEVLKRNRANFISVHHTNIKVSNIKEFGVSKSTTIKAIKAPIFKLNPEYVRKKDMAGKNLFKKLLLPGKYIETGEYKEVSKNEFTKVTIKGNEFSYDHDEYRLPYILVKTVAGIVKDHDRYTRIDENEAKKVYWKYLYITTYQNDNYQFYEDDINIDETLAELDELVNG